MALTPDEEGPQCIIVGRGRGRPLRSSQPSRIVVRFKITAAEKAALREVADFEGRKMADVMRDAIDEYVGDFQERRVFKIGPFE